MDLHNDLTPLQVKAARLADNRVAEAEWDDELLALELQGLKLENFDLDLTGFDEDEIEHLLAAADAEASGDEDAVPEPAAEPITRAGDLWVLGSHRLL